MQQFPSRNGRIPAGVDPQPAGPFRSSPRLFVFAAAALLWCAAQLDAQDTLGRTDTTRTVLQGVQVAEEDGALPGEKIVTCYFIFSGKPSRYTYATQLNDRTFSITFYDAEMGPSPISSQGVPPIAGFQIAKRRVSPAAAKGSLPGSPADAVIVTFALEMVPRISVSDEQGVVSFSYKWTTDPDKVPKYAIAEKKSKIVPVSLAALGGVGVGALVYLLLAPSPPAKKNPVPYDDLPQHVLP